MNYLIALLLTLFSTSNLKTGENIKVGQRLEVIALCTESDDSEIILVHGVLTDTGLIEKRESSILKGYEFEIEEEVLLKKPNLPTFLIDHWKQRNVLKVQEPETCKTISKNLDSDASFVDYSEIFDRIYYQVENKYLVIYKRKDMSTRNLIIPYQVLDKDFNIIGTFSL